MVVVKGFCGVDPYSGDIYNCLAGGGIPSYVVSGKHLTISNYSEPVVQQTIAGEVKTFFETPVVANVAFDMSMQGTTMHIATTTKVFKAITAGSVYVGVHVVENNVRHTYNGQATVTDRFQRTVGGNKTSIGSGYLWIDQLFTAPVSAGASADRTFSIPINAGWNKNELDAIVCVWLRDGSTVRTLSCEDMPSMVNTTNIGRLNGNMSVLIEKINNKLVIIQSENNEEVNQFSLYNAKGRVVYNRDLQQAANRFVVPLNEYPKGVYVATCSGYRTFTSKRIVIH